MKSLKLICVYIYIYHLTEIISQNSHWYLQYDIHICQQIFLIYQFLDMGFKEFLISVFLDTVVTKDKISISCLSVGWYITLNLCTFYLCDYSSLHWIETLNSYILFSSCQAHDLDWIGCPFWLCDVWWTVIGQLSVAKWIIWLMVFCDWTFLPGKIHHTVAVGALH